MAARVPDDNEILEIVRTLKEGGYDTEKEDSEKKEYITNFYPGISDLIYWSSEDLSPGEILKRVKDQNTPIILG